MIAENDGSRVTVDSNDPAALHWLREFLLPSFVFRDGVEASPRIELVADDDSFEAEGRRSGGPGEDVDCFRADGQPVRLPQWRQTRSERVFYDPRNRVFYAVDADRRHYRVLTRRSNLAARFAWMRLVREQVVADLVSRGDVLLHAAALATARGALVIAGAKSTGKTTLLFNALHQHRGLFVSNDRVALRTFARTTMVRGMPTVVSVRPRTLEEHPELLERLLRSGWDHRLALGESPDAAARWTPPRRGRPVDLSPAQFSALLGTSMMSCCPLRAIVFVRRSSRPMGIVARRLCRDEAARRLAAARLFDESRSPSELVPAEANATARDALLEFVSARIPSFDWLVGEGAHLEALAQPIDDAVRAEPTAGP